jgi:hypothetical protein
LNPVFGVKPLPIHLHLRDLQEQIGTNPVGSTDERERFSVRRSSGGMKQ